MIKWNKLHNPILLAMASRLENKGIVMQINNYYFLKIDDRYVHDLYPLLNERDFVQKPSYFSTSDQSGAHITIAYPEEAMIINKKDLLKTHYFKVNSLCKAQLRTKEYFAITIDAPTLVELRGKYNLPSKPYYKNNNVGFHITIAVC